MAWPYCKNGWQKNSKEVTEGGRIKGMPKLKYITSNRTSRWVSKDEEQEIWREQMGVCRGESQGQNSCAVAPKKKNSFKCVCVECVLQSLLPSEMAGLTKYNLHQVSFLTLRKELLRLTQFFYKVFRNDAVSKTQIFEGYSRYKCGQFWMTILVPHLQAYVTKTCKECITHPRRQTMYD